MQMFKSAVVDAAEKLPVTGKGDQIFNTIINTPGVKQSELKWMDLEGFLKNKNKVTKDEVLNFIKENRIDVSEVVLSKHTICYFKKVCLKNVQEQVMNKKLDGEMLRDLSGNPNYDQ